MNRRFSAGESVKWPNGQWMRKWDRVVGCVPNDGHGEDATKGGGEAELVLADCPERGDLTPRPGRGKRRTQRKRAFCGPAAGKRHSGQAEIAEKRGEGEMQTPAQNAGGGLPLRVLGDRLS